MTELRCELVEKWRDDEKRCNGGLEKCDELSRLEGYYEGRADAADELEHWLRDTVGPLVEALQVAEEQIEQMRGDKVTGCTALAVIRAALQRFREGSK